MHGYMGKVLRIDLTKRSYVIDNLPEDAYRLFVGGTGLGAKYLYEEINEGVSPYDPENLLIFATGPLTGTCAPGSGLYSVITRSPLTGLAVSSQANGFFGARVKQAGYDVLVIRGCSSELLYIYINGGDVKFIDASDLCGKDTIESERIIMEKHCDAYKRNPSVACIGPAGENMVRFASIFNDSGHVAASGGVGSVMGSKKLKAIIVGGTSTPQYANKNEALNASKKWSTIAKESAFGKMINEGGTASLFIPYHINGWVPIRNLTTNTFPEAESFDGYNYRKKVKSRLKRCHSCSYTHCHYVTITDGKYKGLETEEPEYEALAAWGPNVGVTDPMASTMLSDLTDRLGMDLKEATFTISLIQESYVAGIISKADTDGLDMDWGNVSSIKATLEKIAFRQGFGNILAEGVMRTAQYYGEEVVNRAVYVKRGNAPHVHDCRTRWGTIFSQLVSNMGSQEGSDLTAATSPELGFPEPIGFSEELIPKAQAKTSAKRQLEDSLGICMFLCRGNGHLDLMIETYNAVTGLNYSVQEALEAGERIINLMRLFNIRHGLTKEDDCISPRLGQPPTDGPGKDQSIAPFLDKFLKNYYEEMGWDKNSGIPLAETLKRLKLSSK